MAAERSDESIGAKPWALPSRVRFGPLSEHSWVTLSGSWEEEPGLLRQTDTTGSYAVIPLETAALIVAPNPRIDRCRAHAEVKVDTNQLTAEAGIAVHVESRDAFVSVSIRRGKGCWYAVLTRWGPYEWGRMPGDVARLPDGTGGRWHTIDVMTDGAHVRATVDGNIALAFSFPLIDGNRISERDQNRDIRLAYNWTPEMFERGGQVGLFTRNAAARFRSFNVEDLPAGTVIHTPYNPEYDELGRVVPRWPYAWIMEQHTEWFLNSHSLVAAVQGSREGIEAGLDEAMEETGWPPYFFAWATVVDDFGFDAPVQWPTHNGPPTISGYIRYYLFSGDERCIDAARQWTDWLIDDFSTSTDFEYPHLPKSTYSYVPRSGEMFDVLELDKASYAGLAYLDVYAVTGSEKYLDAASRIADTLRSRQRPDGHVPFRVDLGSGEVVGEYTCSQLWHVRFFSRLADLTGNDEYRITGERALQWLLNGPVKDNLWWGFYGDNPDAGEGRSFDQWVALETAQWLIDHHRESADFLPAARRIVSFIDETFSEMGGVHRGVPAIGEQTGWPAFLPHHNMRLAETYALLYGATGDQAAKELAVRISNSMTQMVMADGKFHHGLNSGIENRTALGLWFNSQFSRIMAEIPETGPRGENHLLYTSGYVRAVDYEADAVEYDTLGASQEVLLVKSRPRQIKVAGEAIPERDQLPESRIATEPTGWFYEPNSGRLILLHGTGIVRIDL